MKCFEQVRGTLLAWRALGVSERVLNWIEFGVPTLFVAGLILHLLTSETLCFMTPYSMLRG